MREKLINKIASRGELVAAEIVSRLIIDAAYAEAVMPPLVRIADISGGLEPTVEFPSGSISTRVTANEAGIMITVTDMLLNSAGIGGLEPYAEELGKALANRIDGDILSEVSNFENSVGASGVDMTEVDFLEALSILDSGGAPGPYVAILHPIQVNDLRVALASTSGAVWGGPSAPAAELGAFASLYGVDVFKSINCASVNHDADRQGVMMPIGNRSGLAFVLKAGGKVDMQRDAALRATEIIVTADYGKGCVDTTAKGGVAIITDHE